MPIFRTQRYCKIANQVPLTLRRSLGIYSTYTHLLYTRGQLGDTQLPYSLNASVRSFQTTSKREAMSPRSRTHPQPSTSSTPTSATNTPESSNSPSPSASPGMEPRKQNLVILGTGWAGWTLTQELGHHTSPLLKTHNITVLSPHRTMALTPLLASAACSIFDFRTAEEPVRRLSLSPSVKKYQVHVTSVDFTSRKITCVPAVGSNGQSRTPRNNDGAKAFEVDFDTLVLAPGSETNTFGTPGVEEHCLMMRSVQDAMKLRERMLDCFELASLPVYSEDKKRELLHFAIVGGGPTGVELAAEIDELVHNHLTKVYPGLDNFVTVSVYDVADRMLGMFGEKLSEYAMESFEKRDVKVRMGRHITGFEEGIMKIKEDGDVGFGVCVWAAGNKASEMVESMQVAKSDGGMERILTDRHLRVLKPSKSEKDDGMEIVDGVYALGDAADIANHELPTTAEVAVQKAKWLSRHLESGVKSANGKPFEYKQKALVAYIGRRDGVVEGKQDWTGASAWLAWRSGSLEWTRSWRRRVVICLYWALNYFDGREVARR